MIQLMTMWYNEEFLAPFFLNHYKDVDRIHLFIDSDTNDRTIEIAEQYENVALHSFTFPDKMDDIIKTAHFNAVYNTIDSDWVILVDSDEFIYDYQREKTQNIHFTHLYNVFRHVTEKDLDYNLPIQGQRCHGYLDPMYTKPNIVKGRLNNFAWGLGIHECWLEGVHYASRTVAIVDSFVGVHLANADPSYVIERRIKGRKERQSKSNLELGLTIQHHHITEEEIRAELKAHENDERVL